MSRVLSGGTTTMHRCARSRVSHPHNVESKDWPTRVKAGRTTAQIQRGCGSFVHGREMALSASNVAMCHGYVYTTTSKGAWEHPMGQAWLSSSCRALSIMSRRPFCRGRMVEGNVSDKPFLRTPVRWHITTPPKMDDATQCSEAQ